MNNSTKSKASLLFGGVSIVGLASLLGCMTGESTFQDTEVSVQFYPGLFNEPHDVVSYSGVPFSDTLKRSPALARIRLDRMGRAEVAFPATDRPREVSFVVSEDVVDYLGVPVSSHVQDLFSVEDEGKRICLSPVLSLVNARALALRAASESLDAARLQATNELQSALGLPSTSASFREACASDGDVEVVRQALAISHSMMRITMVHGEPYVMDVLSAGEIGAFGDSGALSEETVAKLRAAAGQVDGMALESVLEAHFASFAEGTPSPRVAETLAAIASGGRTPSVCACEDALGLPVSEYLSPYCDECACPAAICDLGEGECGSEVLGLSGLPSSAVKLHPTGENYVGIVDSQIVGFGDLAGNTASGDGRLIAASGFGDFFVVPDTGADWAHFYSSIAMAPVPVARPALTTGEITCLASVDMNSDGIPELVSISQDGGVYNLTVSQSLDWRTPGGEGHAKVHGLPDEPCDAMLTKDKFVYIQQGATISVLSFDGTTYSLDEFASVDPTLQISPAGERVVLRSEDLSKAIAVRGDSSATLPMCAPTDSAISIAFKLGTMAWIYPDPHQPTRVYLGRTSDTGELLKLVPMAADGWTWVSGDNGVVYTDSEGQFRYFGF